MEVQRIFDVIREYEMIQPGMRVVVGVSGGADSVCLLYILSLYRSEVSFELQAVHVEHGIRGDESLADAAYTQELCRRLEVPCTVCPVPIVQIAEKQGLSVEEAGRQERYRCFEEICESWQGDRIAVAHNQNDQAETMIWNLVRGSGLKGLGGIRPVRERIIRPLLFTQRKEIEQILIHAEIAWRTDRTNLTEEYTRNRIRLSVLPQMEEELNAGAGMHIAQAAQKLQQVQDFLERVTQQEARNCLQQEGREVVLWLEAYSRKDELIQMELLKRALLLLDSGSGLKDIGSVHLNMLRRLIGQACGKECQLPGGIRAVREAKCVRFRHTLPLSTESGSEAAYKDSAESSSRMTYGSSTESGSGAACVGRTESLLGCQLPIDGRTVFADWRIKTELLANNDQILREIQIENKYTKWLNYDIINSNVLLRTRRSGDYLIVDAKGGRKKLKDYFIDLKIPREKRDHVLLLADGSHILWVVGYRISEAVKVDSRTKKVLKIQMEEAV